MDTNVVLAGLASSKGFSFLLLEKMIEGKLDFLMSLKLLSEYHQVLTRPENLRRIPLSLSEIEVVLALIVQNSRYQEVYYRWRPNLKDENDNFLIELSIAGGAESLVTFNQKDFLNTQLKFDLLIETPKQYLKRKALL